MKGSLKTYLRRIADAVNRGRGMSQNRFSDAGSYCSRNG
jgi:hypothetical protein